MGRPRARTHPAHTHTHTHSHPHARSHPAVIHQSKSTQPEPDSSPPSPHAPSPPPPPDDHSPAAASGLTVSKVEHPRAGRGCGGVGGPQLDLSRPDQLYTYTHTHTSRGCTHLDAGTRHPQPQLLVRVGGGDLLLQPGPLSPGDSQTFPDGRNGSRAPPDLLFQFLVKGRSRAPGDIAESPASLSLGP